MQPMWQQVRDENDRRKVAYYRYGSPERWFGAVARRGGQWQAVGYLQGRPSTDLGLFGTRRDAERQVVEWWINSTAAVRARGA